MAETLHEHPDFCLPADFLTPLDNKENLNTSKNPNHFCFPSEFPFDFEGVVNSSDVDTQLAELTRQLSLQKPHRITATHQNYQSNYGNSGSPQSTLFQFGGSSNDGSPNGQSQVSSPTSQFTSESSSVDLIHQAAAQVANLKINAHDLPFNKTRDLFSHPNHSQQALNNSSAFYNSFVQRVREEQIMKNQQQRRNELIFQQKQKQKQNRISGLNVGGYFENDETSWPSLQYVMQQNLQKRCRNVSAFPNSGSGNGYFNSVRKSPSVGTGVFLPRNYDNNCAQSKSSKKGCSTPFLHGRGGQPQWQPRASGGVCSDFEVQLAQKNAMLMHQRSTHLQQQVSLGNELGLPQEWTY